MSLAPVRERALTALRIFGSADSGTQFHHCLVVLGRLSGVEKLVGDYLDTRPCWYGLGKKAGEDADDVAVDDGVRKVEGDGGDGSGGVVADSGQGAKGRVIAWEGTERDDRLRGGLQIAGAGVVAESGPSGEKLWFGHLRQSIYSWVEGEKPFIIRDYRRHAGLLEHDL